MARQASILILGAGTAAYNVSQAVSAAAVTTVTLGKYQIFEINADQDIMITVGDATTIATPSASVGKRIPANQQTTLDMGSSFNTLKIFTLGTISNSTGTQTGANPTNIYVTKISVT